MLNFITGETDKKGCFDLSSSRSYEFDLPFRVLKSYVQLI